MLKKLTKKRKKKGFTLVELVVVIAILGILAAIAVPRLSGTRNQAGVAADKATAASIAKAAELYASTENLTDFAELVGNVTNGSTVESTTKKHILVEKDLIKANLVPQNKGEKSSENTSFFLNYHATQKVFYVTYNKTSTDKADVLYPENFTPTGS